MTETKSLEQTPLNAQFAVSSPATLDYASIVQNNAKRKSKNGMTWTTNKGKVSLLTACIDTVRSLMGLPKDETVIAPDGRELSAKTRIDVSHVEALKAEIDNLVNGQVRAIIADAELIGASIRIRKGFLAPKFDADKGTFKTSIKSSIVTDKEQGLNSDNHRMGIVMIVEAAKKRKADLESGIGSLGRDSLEDAIAKCQRKITNGERELSRIKGESK